MTWWKYYRWRFVDTDSSHNYVHIEYIYICHWKCESPEQTYQSSWNLNARLVTFQNEWKDKTLIVKKKHILVYDTININKLFLPINIWVLETAVCQHEGKLCFVCLPHEIIFDMMFHNIIDISFSIPSFCPFPDEVIFDWMFHEISLEFHFQYHRIVFFPIKSYLV